MPQLPGNPNLAGIVYGALLLIALGMVARALRGR